MSIVPKTLTLPTNPNLKGQFSQKNIQKSEKRDYQNAGMQKTERISSSNLIKSINHEGLLNLASNDFSTKDAMKLNRVVSLDKNIMKTNA